LALVAVILFADRVIQPRRARRMLAQQKSLQGEITLDWDAEGNVTQRFTPDFYLPAYDLYIEITTLNQKLVTKKNRKARRLTELYPDVKIRVFYQRDYLSLLMKYGLEPPSQLVTDGAVPPFWLAEPPAPTVAAAAEEPPSKQVTS